MSKVDFSVSIKSHLPETSEALVKALQMWCELTGGEMVNLTHRDKNDRGTPVDTGRLRNSMAHAAADDYKTVYIGTNVEYAVYVEDGARGKDGAHMLRNAVMDVGDKSKEYLQLALESQNLG